MTSIEHKNIWDSIPAIVWFTLGASFVAISIPGQFMGINFSGWGWFLPMSLALFLIIIRIKHATFPILIWLPWILMLLVHCIYSNPTLLDPRVIPYQRVAQLLSPIILGVAASTYRLSENSLEIIISLLKKFGYLIFIGATVGSFALIISGEPTGLAAQVMTALLIAIFFVNRYLLFRQKSDLNLFLLMLSLPILAITRTVIAVSLLVPIISFSPMKLSKRIILILLAAVLSFAVFSLPQVQNKMFHSGEGQLNEISADNEDFATSGRMEMWQVMYQEAKSENWFGHGIGRAETRAYEIASLAYPHNDWLLTYYDFGILGVMIFFISNIWMVVKCLKWSRKSHNLTLKFIFVSSASTFVPFMLVMMTDNIMVYASYFSNIQYLVIGLSCGALKSQNKALRLT